MTDGTSEPLDFSALYDEIQSHPGMLARRSWDSLLDIHVVMTRNQDELLVFVRAVEADVRNAARLAGNVGSDEPRRDMFRELIRRLHNYVASVGTLIDHTRNLMRKYEGTSTYAEFEARRLAATSNDVVSFVSKLRNYVLHVGVPGVGIQFSVTNGEENVTIFLDRDRALQWKDWPKAARRYLNSKPSKLSVVDVIEEYGGVIEELYRWLYDQFPTLHGEDIAAVNELIRRQRFFTT
ncbi:hypothetical protein GCM10022215_06040 [Nocardioides fonticola]|uniref:Uncharacterized protein n=1 Tax=Nocardioides fonticola TaxID=450363 RepID=A0ABP7XC13_9ACTN